MARVRTQQLRRPRSAGRLHTVPKVHGGFGAVARLGHEEQADVVGFGFLFSTRRHGEEEVESGAAELEGEVEGHEGSDADEDERGLGEFLAGEG